MNNEINWEEEYKALASKYDKLHTEHLLLQARDVECHTKCTVQEDNLNYMANTLVAEQKISNARNKHSLKLRAEIRSLHRKLRDANRGAERLHLINAQLRIELVEYKIKHPENIRMGIDVAFGKDQTVTYTPQDHSVKILQQQQDGI